MQGFEQLKNSSDQSVKWSSAVALLLLLILATLLRLAGVYWGLPFTYDVDEPIFVITAFKMLASGDLNPHWFGHPGTTTIYTNAFAFGLEGLRAMAAGEIHQPADMGKQFWTEPSHFYLIARVVSVLFGSATMAVSYFLARSFLGPAAAFAAAALVGVAPLHVEFSQVARTDTQHAFLITLYTLLCIRIIKNGNLKNYLWAGGVLGLAIACKYPSVVASVALVAALAVDRHQRHLTASACWKLILATSIACVAATFIGSPYLFIDLAEVLRDLKVEARTTHLTATSPGMAQSLWQYLEILTIGNFGIAGIVASAVGVIVIFRNRVQTAPAVVLVLVYLLFISSLSLHWARWVIPVLPLICILMASSLEAHNALKISTIWGRRGVQLVSISMVLACMGYGLATSFTSIQERRGVDNRTMANDWINENLPSGTRIAIEMMTPQPDKRRYVVYSAEVAGDLKPDESTSFYASASSSLGRMADPDELKRAGVEYVVLGHMLDLMEREPLNFSKEIKTYQQILADATLVYESAPEPSKNRGNRVRIYSLEKSKRPAIGSRL